MAHAPHVIGKVLFQVRLPDRDTAEPYFERISRFCHDDLPDLLIRLLDTAGCPPDTHIRIDRLTLNAGILTEQDFEAGLLRNLERELRRSLRLAVQQPLPPSRQPSKPAPTLEMLEYFFQHGHFPWWTPRETFAETTPEMLWQEVLSRRRPEAIRLLKKILGQPAARDRLLRQLSPATLEYSAGLLPEKHATRLKKWLTAKPAHLPREPATPGGQADVQNEAGQVEKQLLYFLETGLMPGESAGGIAELEQTLLHFLRRSPGQLRQILTGLSRKTDLAARLAKQFSTELLAELLETLWPGIAPELRLRIPGLQQALEAAFPAQSVKTLFWSAALDFAWTNTGEQAGARAVIEAILTRFAVELDVPETELLQQLEPYLPEKAIRPAPSAGSLPLPPAPPAQPPATDEGRLFYFLETGRFPDSDVGAVQPEQTLLAFLRRSPGQLRQILAGIGRKTDLTTRLAKQFSTELLAELLETLWPGIGPELRLRLPGLQQLLEAAFPGQSVKTLFWSAALDLVWTNTGELADAGAVIKAILTRLSAELDVPETELPRQVETYLQETALAGGLSEIQEQLFEDAALSQPRFPAPETALLPAGADTGEQLFYFLEWSRLPTGLTAVPSDWEQILLNLLRESPAPTRQHLLDINRKMNLAPRLIRHFGLPVQREVLHTLFPEQWAELETVLSDLSKLLPASRKGDARAWVWETALERLLAYPANPVDMPALVAFLAGQSVIRNPQSAIHVSTWKYLQMASAPLSDTEQATLQAGINQWQADDARQSATGINARTTVDRLLYRLTQGRPAWWDDTALSDDQLFELLAALPPGELRTALVQLWPATLRKQWLPALPPKTFEHLLRVFWGDYAAQVNVYIDTFGAIAGEMRFELDQTALREAFFEAALKPDVAVHSGFLFQTALRRAVRASPWTAAQWTEAVEARAAAAITGGDIRFHRVREVLREQDEFPAAGANAPEIPSVPESPETTTDRPAYPEILRGELQAVWQFLRLGVLSPAAHVPTAGAMEQLLLRLFGKHPALILPVFRENLDRRDAAERITRHFSGKTWRSLGALLWHPHFDNIQHWWREVAGRLERAGPDSSSSRLERHFFTYLFQQAGVPAPHVYDPAHLLEGLIRFIAEKENIPETLIWEQIKTAKPGAPPDTLDAIIESLEQRREQTPPPPAPRQHQTFPDSPAAAPGEAIAVHNAGLVILAPYLGRFFGALNMLDGDVFKDENAAERGVHLLQYMATRQTETPEHLLVLNKVLCGLPVGTPVSAGIILNAEEENLCHFLLNTVLQNWEMMKNSSVANLQGAFILRDGLLREGADKWQLNVEKKAYDIVLDYLPWTISMVKLPWMEKRIEVEWKKKS